MESVFLIALNTFRESVRSKILYSVLFFAALLIVVSAFFGSVTIGDQVRVIKDFGLFSISLFSVLYAVISGAALLYKELSRKTIYNILAKSVKRWEFVLGKYLGMLITVAVLISLMTLGFLVFLYFFEARFDWLILQASFQIFLELSIVCAFAIFFSCIVVTPLLSGVFTLGVFLAGRSTDYLLFFVKNGTSREPLTSILKGLYVVLPHLDKINISDLVVYDKALELNAVVFSIFYAASYIGCLMILAALIFKKREFN